MVAMALAASVLLAFGLVCLVRGASDRFLLLFAVVYAGMALPAVVGVRIFRRLVEDTMSWAKGRNRGWPTAPLRRVLLIGAGDECTLLLRARRIEEPNRDLGRGLEVVGLIDEDSNLHGRYVYGYRVLGNIDHLDTLAEQHRIGEFIVTAATGQRQLDRVIETARRHGVRVTRWQPVLETVYVPTGNA